ncbi:MAG: hypothetical protein ACRD1J_03260, partial [Terriglobia bacterium]
MDRFFKGVAWVVLMTIAVSLVYLIIYAAAFGTTPWEARKVSLARAAELKAEEACTLNDKPLFDQAFLDAQD